MRNIVCNHVLTAATEAPLRNQVIRIEDGKIVGIGDSGADRGRFFALPALVNAHDHARAVRSSSIGAGGKPLETWLHYLALLPAVDPYVASAASLSRSALGGAGTVMVHYTRTQGLTDLPTEAKEVARAARDVGVRVGFAVALRDRNPLVYGPSEPILDALPEAAREDVKQRMMRPARSVPDMMALVEEIIQTCDAPDFSVHYGPAGVQWCSHDLLVAIAKASADNGRRIHMHLLETRYQRTWADENFPQGIVTYLDEIGLLTPRLTLAHCTWARPAELELIAIRGATIAVNTSSNLGIRSGIAPLAEMARQGCRVAFGLDGLALDEDDDAVREMRLANLLHGGSGFRTDIGQNEILAMAFANGHRSVLNRDADGSLKIGAPADLLLIDWDKLDDERLGLDIDPRDLLFARATARHLSEVIVAGRSIVRDGAVLGVNLPEIQKELLDQIRSGIGKSGSFMSALVPLERAICNHFEPDCPCC